MREVNQQSSLDFELELAELICDLFLWYHRFVPAARVVLKVKLYSRLRVIIIRQTDS